MAVADLDYFEMHFYFAKTDDAWLLLAFITQYKLIRVQLSIGNVYVQSRLLEDICLRDISGKPLSLGNSIDCCTYFSLSRRN